MSHEENGETLRKRGHVVVVDHAANVEIPLENIVWQGPTDITEQQIKNMATSLMTTGQIEPIVVTQADKKGIHTGVVGRLRYEGMKYRWRNEPQGKTILCRIRRFKDDVDGQIEAKTWQLVENLHRRDLPVMMRARQYRELYDLMRQKHGEQATLNMLAATIEELTGNKESTKTVQHYLELTKLQPRTQEILTGEKLSLRAGLEFARVTDPKKQVKAAEDVRKHQYHDVQSIHWHVESLITDERRDHQKERLKKRADELRKEGKIVIIEAPYSDMSYKEREKYQIFYGEVPEECKIGAGCPKLGVQLSGNFQQKPMCTDRKCYENMQRLKTQKLTRVQRENEKKFEDERAKVYVAPLDVHHFRLLVLGLIDDYTLSRTLKLGFNEDKKVVLKVNEFTREECMMLLLRKAAEHVLSEPDHYSHDEARKVWAVNEWHLTPEIFLKREK